MKKLHTLTAAGLAVLGTSANAAITYPAATELTGGVSTAFESYFGPALTLSMGFVVAFVVWKYIKRIGSKL